MSFGRGEVTAKFSEIRHPAIGSFVLYLLLNSYQPTPFSYIKNSSILAIHCSREIFKNRFRIHIAEIHIEVCRYVSFCNCNTNIGVCKQIFNCNI
jgi:hypothetical protein